MTPEVIQTVRNMVKFGVPFNTPRRKVKVEFICDELEKAQNRWISVKDRLPDINYPDEILVAVKNPFGTIVLMGFFHPAWEDDDIKSEPHWEIDSNYVTFPAEITHWQPLPSPPEEE